MNKKKSSSDFPFTLFIVISPLGHEISSVEVCVSLYINLQIHADLYLLLYLRMDRKSNTPTRRPIMMLSSCITETLTWSSLKAVGTYVELDSLLTFLIGWSL